jgi:hypothetical protein
LSRRRRSDPRQLDLFAPPPEAAPAPPREPAPSPEAPTARAPAPPPAPEWDFLDGWAHVDFVEEDQPCVVFLYPYDDLETAHGGGLEGYFAVEAGLFRAFVALRGAPKSLRERAFTVFAGDCGPGYSILGVALGSQDGRLTQFVTPHLKVPGYRTLEVTSTGPLVPKFRYDHGHVIQYAEPDLAGTTAVDDDEGHGTGLVLHRRACMPPDAVGLRRSTYGRLRSPSAARERSP